MSVFLRNARQPRRIRDHQRASSPPCRGRPARAASSPPRPAARRRRCSGGPGEVLAHDAVRAPRMQRARDHGLSCPPSTTKSALACGQRHGLAHGDRHVGARQHRAIVHAVADHGDAMAALLQPPHMLQLVLGRLIAASSTSMPARRARRRDCAASVAGQQLHAQPEPLQAPHGRHGIGAQCLVQVEACKPALLVGQMNLAGGAAVSGRQIAERCRAQFQLARLPRALAATLRLTRRRPRSPPRETRPARGSGARPRWPAKRDAASAGPARPRAANASAASVPGRQWLLTHRDLRCGQRAGLVEHHGVDAGARLQRLRGAHQHAAPRQRAGRGEQWRPAWPATTRRGR